MPRELILDLPVATKLLNETLRMHWTARRTYQRNLAWHVRAALGADGIGAPMARAIVTIERYSAGTPDHDGLVGGMKALIDCLLVPSPRHPHGLGILLDDSPDHMTLIATSHPAPRGRGRTVVRIAELATAEPAEMVPG